MKLWTMPSALKLPKAANLGYNSKIKASWGGGSSKTYAPMELGAINVKKLTPEERDKCMRQGLGLRCRQPGHMAKDCTQFKGLGNAVVRPDELNDENPEN
jgi:Zinc knuckle